MTSRKPLRDLGRHQFAARLRPLVQDLNQAHNANNAAEEGLPPRYVYKNVI